MDKFWELFRESIILQGLLTIGLWGTIVVLILQGRAVPDILLNAGSVVLGFWFGTKVQNTVNHLRR